MIAVYIIAGIVVFVLALLFLPVSAVINYDDEFSFYIRILGIKIRLPDRKKSINISKTDEKPKQKGKIGKKIKKDGIVKTVKGYIAFAKKVIDRIGYLSKRVYVRDFKLRISVGGADAALTAIEYGTVCAVVYPFLRYIYSLVDFKAKQVDIISDFDNKESSLTFHIRFAAQPLVLLTAAYGIYEEYKLLTGEKENERK